MKKIITTSIMFLLALQCFAQQEYKATVFGAKSDGVTDNTATIQRAIDFISENGGGKLVFYVGRYLTGAVELKDNVTIDLREAAVLVSSTNIYTYKGKPALIWAEGRSNVGITGKGAIEGRNRELQANIDGQKARGYIPADFKTPELCSFVGCTDAVIGEEVKLVKNTVAEPYRK